MKFTTEMLEKAKTAKTAEELLELAKAENIELTAEEAAKYFADLHRSGELSDAELDNVAGGCAKESNPGGAERPEDVLWLYWIGKYVEVLDAPCVYPSTYSTRTGGTHAATITDKRIVVYEPNGCYYPQYKVKYRDKDGEEWVYQTQIED